MLRRTMQAVWAAFPALHKREALTRTHGDRRENAMTTNACICRIIICR